MTHVRNFLGFEQDGVLYDLYNLPDGLVIKDDLDISGLGLIDLPDLSKITVKGNFLCYNNKLVSLAGSPKVVEGHFMCINNQLTKLDGLSEKIGGDLWCEDNPLTSLQKAAERVGNNIYADESILEKYGAYTKENDNFGLLVTYISSSDLKNTTYYKSEKIINSKEYTRYKVLRTLAAENVSPQKGVINPKRSDAEKKAIKSSFNELLRGKIR